MNQVRRQANGRRCLLFAIDPLHRCSHQCLDQSLISANAAAPSNVIYHLSGQTTLPTTFRFAPTTSTHLRLTMPYFPVRIQTLCSTKTDPIGDSRSSQIRGTHNAVAFNLLRMTLQERVKEELLIRVRKVKVNSLKTTSIEKPVLIQWASHWATAGPY